MKTQKLIDLFIKKNGVITLSNIYSSGMKYKYFMDSKNTINNHSKKWKEYKIVRKGKAGQSTWLFAQIEPKSSINYSKMIIKGATKKVIFASKINLIAIANENNAIERLNLAKQITQSNEEFLTVVNKIV